MPDSKRLALVGRDVQGQKDLIVEILASSEWSTVAKTAIRWQYKMQGDFEKALWGALVLADEQNLERFRLGYGVEVATLLEWRHGDIGKRLREAGLDI